MDVITSSPATSNAFIFVVLDCAPAGMNSMHTKAQPAEKKAALDAAAERLFHCRAAFLATLGIAATAPSSTHPPLHRHGARRLRRFILGTLTLKRTRPPSEVVS